MELSHTTSSALPVVRQEVRRLLTESSAFRSLSKPDRDALAHHMVKVASYIVSGADGHTVPTSAALAGDQPVDPAGETAGQRITGAASQSGAQSFQDLVNKVDFPKFVAGLVDGVFNAIVTSSIKQMEAYAELVKNVSKSVDEYMKDNVSENNARDYLAQRYPDHLQVDIAGEKPQLKAREGADTDNMPDFFKDLGLAAPVDSLDDETVEQTLVPAARRRIAMDRQQTLATMVMMGINRLVVTNGHLEASVLFEVDTSESVNRHYAQTSDFDYNRTNASQSGVQASGSRTGSWSGDWKGDNASGTWKGQSDRNWSWYNNTATQDTVNFKVTTVRSEDSESKIDLHAKLGGKVNLNFKSDYFPLEKMVNVLQMNQIQQNSLAAQPASPPATAPAEAAPPAPPLPPLPGLPAPAAPPR